MAGKGGGAWKVAYADFVTAMMAFFLVMWLCAQNQEVKRTVADYFSDPLGTMEGNTKGKAGKSGSLVEHVTAGSVPLQEKVALGKGRQPYSRPGPTSPATRMVGDWLHRDSASIDFWKKQAKEHRDTARFSDDVKQKRKGIAQVAVEKLAVQLKDEFMRNAPEATGVYRDLLLDAYKDVNWTELAEDLVGP